MADKSIDIPEIEFARLITSVESGFISLQAAEKQINKLKSQYKKSIRKRKTEKFSSNISPKPFLVVGITGPPGTGKSTIIDLMLDEFIFNRQKIGVIAIDPTSVRSGGAFLGDRIRMQKHANDKGIFIRSMATRGHFGGLGANTREVLKLFQYAGFDIVIIETVGIGQTEVEIAKAADVVIAVTTPANGDEIQLLKAGIFELCNIIVLNKSDYEKADLALRNLQMLSDNISAKGWKIPIVKMIASEGKGVKELHESLKEFYLKFNKVDEQLKVFL